MVYFYYISEEKIEKINISTRICKLDSETHSQITSGDKQFKMGISDLLLPIKMIAEKKKNESIQHTTQSSTRKVDYLADLLLHIMTENKVVNLNCVNPELITKVNPAYCFHTGIYKIKVIDEDDMVILTSKINDYTIKIACSKKYFYEKTHEKLVLSSANYFYFKGICDPLFYNFFICNGCEDKIIYGTPIYLTNKSLVCEHAQSIAHVYWIIENDLAVLYQDWESNIFSELKRAGFKTIISFDEIFDVIFSTEDIPSHGFKHHKLYTKDLISEHLPEDEKKFLNKVHLFIDILNNMKKEDKPVLVHCLGGTDRTPIAIICYLISTYKAEAIDKATDEVIDKAIDELIDVFLSNHPAKSAFTSKSYEIKNRRIIKEYFKNQNNYFE